MSKYSLTVIFDPESEKSQQEAFVSEVEKMIADAEGKLVKKEAWGKKELNSPIKKKEEGLFFLFSFEAPSDKIKEIEKKLRFRDLVLRSLLTTD